MSKKASVAIVMVKGDGAYLMQRIGTETYRDYWAFAGGHIEQGETSLQAAEREFKEETGLHPNFYQFYPLGLNEREQDYLCVIYAVKLTHRSDDRPQNKEPEKHSDWKWFSFSDILELENTIPGIRSIIGEHFFDKKVHTTW